MSKTKEKITKLITPIIKTIWNVSNKEKCEKVNVSFAYFPKEYDGDNPPIIRYTLFFQNGKTQSSLNCSNPFVELINSFTKHLFEYLIGY